MIAIAATTARQAAAAKRLADAAHGDVDPTFYVEIHEDDGRPTGGLHLLINNFNRRALRVTRLRLADVPSDLIVWDEDHKDPDSVRKILEATLRTGEAAFDVGVTLPGIAPNATQPTTAERNIYVGLKGDTANKARKVALRIHVHWQYATSDGRPQTDTLTVQVPVGIK